jgi:hypothetical protein
MVVCPGCDGAKAGFAIVCSADRCRSGMRACDFCKGEGQVSSEAAELWREGSAMRDARVKEGRSQLQEAKRLGISPVDLNDIEFGRKSKRDVLNENHSSDGKERNTAPLLWRGLCGVPRTPEWALGCDRYSSCR